MYIVSYNQFNSSTPAKERMVNFCTAHNVPEFSETLGKTNDLWNRVYHRSDLKHLFITVPYISKNIEDLIVFAVNRNINVYVVTDYTDVITIKGLKATYQIDPKDKRNLIWTRTAHSAFYPDDLRKLVMEEQAFQEALEDRYQLRKELVQMKHTLGIEFPSPEQMLLEVRRDAEPFDVEIDYTRLPAKVVEHFTNDGSLNDPHFAFTGNSIETDTDFNLDEDTAEYYVNFIAQAWLTIQYYKEMGLTPDPKEYVQCPECGQWHHRVRVEHCPKCDRLNPEYHEVIVKDFQVAVEVA